MQMATFSQDGSVNYKFTFLLFTFSSFASAFQPIDEAVVPSGKYYVGSVFGQHDYAEHPNITLDAFRIMRSEVTYRLYTDVHTWATQHGYAFGSGCNGAANEDCLPADTDKGAHPVTNVEWADAVIFANALSEKTRLRPVYLNRNGAPARDSASYAFTVDPQAEGYRLPTAEEWQVAARGGVAGLKNGTYGYSFAGSKNASAVACFPDFNHPDFGTATVKSFKPNAAGLYDMSGNVAEWVYAFDTISGVKMYYFCGGSYMVHTSSLANCDTHSAGYALPDVGFRLVRKY
ncbi:SUMF1/EgtB/PvdO family nonheme iron enzyme [Mangrovibacter plantisponsor]|uniref:Sulfatase-modifying factor enzyme 1 n=1 Tax=Mangrovibacter plantisponsor TaxID=451513 RepID=A0A317PJU7_9ENTR|nr:SUMF1/EgtB/PvdO family nonheme iron enzyme [Mangrovibacter plantisponsor]PWW01041.1 sulfatase-modifying factor enzyme 1 [Mangrovibacter plantisponsor]